MNFQYETLGDEYQFQIFLKDLFNAAHSTETFQEYGSKGNLQHGIDIYCSDSKTAIQAKKKDINRSKKLVIKELLSDLEETLEKIKGFPFPVEKLFFATTLKKDITLQKACIDASFNHGIDVILFSWDDIQEKLPHYPSVRNKYFPHLQQAEISNTDILKKLEELLSKNSGRNDSIQKQYRDIPTCDVILPALPDDLQKVLIANIIKMALYDTFATTVYKKFSCLINFSLTYTQFSDGTSGPGFQIISGEVIFLSKCNRLVKELQNNSERFWERVEQFENNPDFKNIRFRMELHRIKGLTSYEFEIDGQTDSYSIKAKHYDNLDYDKLGSLSAVLPFIAVTTKPVINIIDLDKIESHPAFMKLFYHLLNENSFKPNLLKININDFDDWDYEYKPSAD